MISIWKYANEKLDSLKEPLRFSLFMLFLIPIVLIPTPRQSCWILIGVGYFRLSYFLYVIFKRTFSTSRRDKE